MYEKNIVGVYNHLQEYPVFQHVKSGEKKVDRVQYAPEQTSTPGTVRDDVSQQDPLEQWRDFSRQLRNRKRDNGGQSGQSQSGKQSDQPKDQRPDKKPVASRQFDQMVEARVRSHIQPLTPPEPVHPVQNALHAIQHHLREVTHALPDDHHGIFETMHELESDEHVGWLRLDQVMTRRVVCIRETVTLEEAASLCNRRGLSGLPVVDDQNRLLGTISLKKVIHDLFAPEALSHFAAHGGVLETEALEMLDQPVSQHLEPHLLTLPPDTPLNQACRQMSEQGCERLVVTVDGVIKGLFTSRDAVRVLAAAHIHEAG